MYKGAILKYWILKAGLSLIFKCRNSILIIRESRLITCYKTKGMSDTKPTFWFSWITAPQVCLHSLKQTKELSTGAAPLPQASTLKRVVCTWWNTEPNSVLSARLGVKSMETTLTKNLHCCNYAGVHIRPNYPSTIWTLNYTGKTPVSHPKLNISRRVRPITPHIILLLNVSTSWVLAHLLPRTSGKVDAVLWKNQIS